MKRKKRIGLLTLLSLFVASILTATSFGYWNLSSEVSATISENTQNVETKANQYTSDRAVCYLDNASTVFYTSIEKALSVATSGRTVYVIPGLKGTDGNSYPIHIKNDCTIPSGVTLSLPYDGTTVFDSTVHGPNTNFADYSLAAVKTNRQTQVVIDENVTLTVLGTLNIGGIIGGPSAGVSGNTTSSYCEITMSANSEIICESGKIYCYGYIKRTTASNNSLLTIGATGKIHTPFVIYDFKGGTATLGIYNLSGDNRFCPFTIFDVCNVQTKTMIKSGAYWETRTLVYIGTNSTYYPEKDADRIINFISPRSTKTAIILTSGYLTTEYTPKTNGITTSSASSSNTLITIYGTAEIGTISISMKVTAAIITKTISIDTGNFFFPISYRLSITVENGGVLNVSKKVKAMNGSDLLIKKGGTVNITNQLIIYDDFVENTSSLPSPYPSGLPAATLINNGVINVTGSGAIGGYINTTESGATLNYQSSIFSVSSPEYGGTMPSGAEAVGGSSCSVTQYKKNAIGTLTNGADATYVTDIVQYNYLSQINPLNNNEYAWLYPSLIIPIPLTNVTIENVSSTNGSANFTAQVEPSNATGVTYLWSVDNSSLSISSVTSKEITITNSTTGSITANLSVTVNGYNGSTDTDTKAITISAPSSESGGGCLSEDTLVMLSDGTYKRAIEIRAEDMLMTINHENGEFEAAPVVFNDDYDKEAEYYNVITLEFSNGKSVEIIYEHGFFDLNTMKYEYITEENYSSFIGHEFVTTDYIDNNLIKGKATLVNAYVTRKFIRICSPVTYKNLNIITEGMLSMPGGITGIFNIFEYDADLSYNAEKKQQDIETYGLFDYSHFEDRIPYEFYEAFNGQYLKVAIGKGMLTEEMINQYIERYLPIVNEQN